MSIPAIEEIKPKTLQFLADGEVRRQQEISHALAGPDYFNLTQEQLAEKRANGKSKFFGKCETASTYLNGEELIEYPKDGYRKITADGLKALNSQRTGLQEPKDAESGDNLRKPNRQQPLPFPQDVFPEVEKVKQKTVDSSTNGDSSVPVEETYRGIRKILEEALLQELRQMDPTVFEQLVVDLISKMGYGTGKHVGRVGDGGIDGIVTDHRLGLYKVYIQTKRQGKTATKTDIVKFRDALRLQEATVGIFVAISRFSKPFYKSGQIDDYKSVLIDEKFRIFIDTEFKNEVKICLIDGEELARLLLEYNVFHG